MSERTRFLAWALALAQLPATAAAQRSPAVVESQRVTAFDLLVELSRPKAPARAVQPPADLALGDFTMLWDGAALPLVGLARGDEDREPWRLVVYVDRVLASNHTVRWAAMELAERVDLLTELGEVEIVVADPEPRRLLAATRDGELVDGALSGVFLAPAGAAHLVRRREEHLIDPPRGPPAGSGIAGRQAEEERLLVRRQTDRLLGWLVESEPPTSRRAVLLVGDGWDERPEEFYARADGPAAAPPVAPRTADPARELGETLAAYGWIVAPLAPPAPAVGVGRFGAYVLPDHTFPWLFAVKLRSLVVWLDGNRAPKKADALTELGDSLRAAGRLDRALESYRKAVYHYYDHPKTAKRQARALVALGETLELLDDRPAARAAFRTATVFDPTLEHRFPFAAAKLLAPREPLARLAELSAGALVTEPVGLDRLLASLGHRLRITTQLAGEPDGALHRLALRSTRSELTVRFPTVARWGTPPAVTRQRLRGLLDGQLTAGDLELGAAPADPPAQAGDGLRVDLRLAAAEAAAAPTGERLRISWASSGPGSTPTYRLGTATLTAGEDGAAAARLSVAPPTDHLWLAFLVEDPAGGAWGGASLELPDR